MDNIPPNYDSLPDMFPGFAKCEIKVGNQTFFLRLSDDQSGDKPPLLLIHGYPQNHVCWHKIAPALAEHYSLIIPDLPGYGRSSIPPDTANHSSFSKRTMAQLLVGLMKELGYDRFAVIGHDRGARVAYRLTLDHGHKVTQLACLDIIPTLDMWQEMDATRAVAAYHWQFLAQPQPMPETLIMADPAFYLDHTIASWSKSRDLSAFDPGAMAHYRATFASVERVHAACEDYRAGWTIDQQQDEADRKAGRMIHCPTLVISGPASKTSKADAQETIWQNWTEDVQCHVVDGGHFVAEECPDDVLALLLKFLDK